MILIHLFPFLLSLKINIVPAFSSVSGMLPIPTPTPSPALLIYDTACRSATDCIASLKTPFPGKQFFLST